MSSTKAVSAVALLRLWDADAFDLDDRVTRFIPEFGQNGKEQVTIRHLLTHTGGLRDVFLLRELAASRGDGAEESDAVVHLLARQRGLNFTPGTKYEYKKC